MPQQYIFLSRDTETLLFSINKIYKENNFDVAKTNSNFTELFLHNPSYPPALLEEQIKTLINGGYLTDKYGMQPSDLGLHYRYFQFLYWKHRFIVPASVSFFVAILANVIIYFSGLK